MSVDSKLVSFSFRKARKKVLYSLEGQSPQTPKKLSITTKIGLSNLRRILTELKDKDLIYCDNKEEYHNKLYNITKKGIEVLKEIKKLEIN